MNILIILIIKLVYSYDFSFSKYNNFGNKFLVNNKLDEISNLNEKIIFECHEGDSLWRNDYIKLYSKKNNIRLLDINFNKFMNNNKIFDYDIIYINDFLIKDGRILSEKEIYKILNYEKSLLLGCDDLSKVSYKDYNFLSKLKKIKLDKVSKKEIMHYIYSLIDYYKYDGKLMMINWKNYNIDLLNFAKTENKFFLLHVYISLNKKIGRNINIKDIINNF